MKTRFCPSPTGNVHLGNVRTALFNALLAHKVQGTFLLRIEDTDRVRSNERYTHQLMEDLHWLGLDWQEGPEVGGELGPYWQSQRQAIYDEYYARITETGQAYPCFCTEQHLAIMRKIQLAAHQAPRYDGTCRHLTSEQVEEKIAQGLQPTLRFKVPNNEVISFEDTVKGHQSFAANDLGDFIIRRADGTPPFMFCNAIDDAMMKVTHVLRGEDHLTNTPRQLLILQALGLHIPNYGHISLILGEDGGPLSKRLGSQSIKEMRTQGYLPLAILNYLARLGHYYASNDFSSFTELAQGFELKSLSSSPARFDQHHLYHWQKTSVMNLDDAAFWLWGGPELDHLVPKELQHDFIQAVRPNSLFPEDTRHWAQRLFAAELQYSQEDIAIFRSAGENFFATALEAVAQVGADSQALVNILQEKLGLKKGKSLFQPLRVALTSVLDGPELALIFKLLGKERISARFDSVLRII